MLKNSVKMSNYLSNLWTNISGIKWIVCRAKKFGIWSLFISIWFEIDRIVHAWSNIAVTSKKVFDEPDLIVPCVVVGGEVKVVDVVIVVVVVVVVVPLIAVDVADDVGAQCDGGHHEVEEGEAGQGPGTADTLRIVWNPDKMIRAQSYKTFYLRNLLIFVQS